MLIVPKFSAQHCACMLDYSNKYACFYYKNKVVKCRAKDFTDKILSQSCVHAVPFLQKVLGFESKLAATILICKFFKIKWIFLICITSWKITWVPNTWALQKGSFIVLSSQFSVQRSWCEILIRNCSLVLGTVDFSSLSLHCFICSW